MTSEIKPISRRGDLTNNVLGVILAIGGLLMLAFLGAKLYNLYVSQDEKNAAAVLDSLVEKIKNVEDKSEQNFVLNGVQDWFLVAWVKTTAEESKPGKCFDKDCLCICKSSSDKDTCQQNGICKDIGGPIEVSSNVLTGPTFKISSSAHCIYILKKLQSFNVKKDGPKITLFHDQGLWKDDELYKKYKLCEGFVTNFVPSTPHKIGLK